MSAMFLRPKILGLLLVMQGQGSVPVRTVASGPVEATLYARQIEVGAESKPAAGEKMMVRSRVVAKGVEIRLGSSVLVADEGEIRYGATGERSDVELRGNVHLKAVLEVKDAGLVK